MSDTKNNKPIPTFDNGTKTTTLPPVKRRDKDGCK